MVPFWPIIRKSKQICEIIFRKTSLLNPVIKPLWTIIYDLSWVSESIGFDSFTLVVKRRVNSLVHFTSNKVPNKEFKNEFNFEKVNLLFKTKFIIFWSGVCWSTCSEKMNPCLFLFNCFRFEEENTQMNLQHFPYLLISTFSLFINFRFVK